MRAGIFLTWILAGACSFESRVQGMDPVDAVVGTDGAIATPDATPDSPPVPVTCTTSDPDLRLCLELDDADLSGTAIDGSGRDHHATVNAVTLVSRTVPSPSQAIGTTDSTAVMIADHADFDLQRFTLTAWLQRTALPGVDAEYGVVDFGRQQASIAIDSQGRVSCLVKVGGTVWFLPGAATTNGEWTLAACSYDTPMVCATVFRNGSATPIRNCGMTSNGTVNTSVNVGGTIGAMFDDSNALDSRFAGSIDSVRVYSRVLSEDEICAKSGITGC